MVSFASVAHAHAVAARAIQSKKIRKPTLHHSQPIDLRDPRKRLVFIVTFAVVFFLCLFTFGLVFYYRKELNRKKTGLRPRWGRIVWKALTVATLIWIPIWIYKKIRGPRKGSYNRIGEAGGSSSNSNSNSNSSTGANNTWYGVRPASVAAATAAVPVASAQPPAPPPYGPSLPFQSTQMSGGADASSNYGLPPLYEYGGYTGAGKGAGAGAGAARYDPDATRAGGMADSRGSSAMSSPAGAMASPPVGAFAVYQPPPAEGTGREKVARSDKATTGEATAIG